MRTLVAIFVLGFVALALYAVQPWRWLAPAPPPSLPAPTAPAPPVQTDTPPTPTPPQSSPPANRAASANPAANAAPAPGTPSSAPAHDPTKVPSPTQPTTPGAPALDAFDIIPSEQAAGVDGNPVYDGEFALKGQGTQASPYEITWEYLTSIERTYDPSVGRRQVPERIAMLNGKYVRITGYIAFPIVANRPDELLVMLNQWDGCCIGVPPTPYDAIEVRLTAPVTGEDRYTTYATITGRLGVEPYVSSSTDGKLKFLLGIYVLNGATMTGSELGNQGY